jgi:hypothetical protein
LDLFLTPRKEKRKGTKTKMKNNGRNSDFSPEDTHRGVGPWKVPGQRLPVRNPQRPEKRIVIVQFCAPNRSSDGQQSLADGDGAEEKTAKEEYPRGTLYGVAQGEGDYRWFEEPPPIGGLNSVTTNQRATLTCHPLFLVALFVVVFMTTTILGGCAARKLLPKKMAVKAWETVSVAPTVHPVLWVPPKNEIPLVEPAPADTPPTSAQPRVEASKSAAKPKARVRFRVDTDI